MFHGQPAKDCGPCEQLPIPLPTVVPVAVCAPECCSNVALIPFDVLLRHGCKLWGVVTPPNNENQYNLPPHHPSIFNLNSFALILREWTWLPCVTATHFREWPHCCPLVLQGFMPPKVWERDGSPPCCSSGTTTSPRSSPCSGEHLLSTLWLL